MKRFMLRLVVWLLRVIYTPLKQFKARNKLTLISRQSDEVPADFMLIQDYFSQNRPDIQVQCLARKFEPKSFSVITYPFHMLRQMYHISTSKATVLDGYCIIASVLKHKDENIIIQMWHASAAIKKFGWQIVGKPSGSNLDTATIMRMHANYNYILAPSKTTGLIYQEAFKADIDKIVYYGLPHLSLLQKHDQNRMDEISRAFNIDSKKETILYVPTFRNGKSVNLQDLISEIDFQKYNLVVKVHPIDKLPPVDQRIIYAKGYTTLEWMQLADVVITDYSSLVVEAALLNKPLYLYVYDIDDYMWDPGLNLDFANDVIRPVVFPRADSLVKQLEAPYDYNVLQSFLSKYIEIDIPNCQRDLGRFIETQIDGDGVDEKKD